MTRLARCVCGKPTLGQSYICAECLVGYRDVLDALPALVRELSVTLSRQQRVSGSPRVGSPASHTGTLPFSVPASDLLHALRTELVSQVRLCVEQQIGPRGWPSNTLASMSMYLHDRSITIAGLPWAGDALGLCSLAERASQVIDSPPERLYAGPCHVCHSDVYAEAGRLDARCERCGQTYALAERRAWLLDILDDRLATAIEIGRALTSLAIPISSERVRQWRHRGRLTVRGHDAHGLPLYRVGDVRDLLDEQARRADRSK